ncbi:MAG: MBL fold metallo-hydrolase [Oscillospiraceae bacterium]|nr:MBL fold metallo-hydrolase [Oscillospiraceae bacterium]
MLIKCFSVGSFETNCYVVTDEQSLRCAVIDPGADAATILDYLEENRLTCAYVLLTHGHFDHTGAVEAVRAETLAPLYLHKADDGISIGGPFYRFTAPKDAHFFREGDVIALDRISFAVLETPGHTPGSVSLLAMETDSEERALFTGDTLFRDSCGRTDFPGGDQAAMFRSLRRLAELPGDYEVYPGHMESTTLNRERRVNPFVLYALGGRL